MLYKDNRYRNVQVIVPLYNWKGEGNRHKREDFATKKEAQAWEHEAMLKQGRKADMTFEVL